MTTEAETERMLAIIADLETQLDRAIKICHGYRDLNRNLLTAIATYQNELSGTIQ